MKDDGRGSSLGERESVLWVEEVGGVVDGLFEGERSGGVGCMVEGE